MDQDDPELDRPSKGKSSKSQSASGVDTNPNEERLQLQEAGKRTRKCWGCACRCCVRRDADHVGGEVYFVGITCSDQMAYFFDRLFAKSWTLALMMIIIGLFLVIIGGLLYSIVWRDSDRSDIDDRDADEVHRIQESFWMAWTFMADPGTHADVSLPGQRVIGSLITLSGILFFASILGMTVDVIREKMDTLRKGKSKIIEKNHTLILGWTQKTFHIVEELCNANESEGGGVVAILSPESKERMESELRLQLPAKARRGTRIVIRSGSPLVMGDLVRVSAQVAKAIIILATSAEADTADANTLRTLLSLNTLYNQTLRGFIVAEARDIDNEPLVKLVGNKSVETVVSHDMIGRLMLMSVRQPGLAKVYEALLGFEGDEFYMKEWPELVGLSFGDLQLRFPDAIPIGIMAKDGLVHLQPSRDHKVCEGDEIIVIAEDDGTYKPESPVEVAVSDPPDNKIIVTKVEKILICGWRRDIRDILKQLDRIATRGTEVHMLTHCVQIKDRNAKLLEDGLDVAELLNIQIMHFYGNTSVRRHLDALPIDEYTSCMIFADQAFETDTMYADSHSLATLLLVRDIQANRSMSLVDSDDFKATSAIERLTSKLQALRIMEVCPIVCEILDPHTQKTIVGNQHLSILSDFCQTNRLTAQVMAMVAEERAVKILLDELLGSVGCSIAVVPSSRYVHTHEQISFYEVSRRAGTFGELVFGYQRRNSIDKTVLNPRKKVAPYNWDSYDFAILQGSMDTIEKQAFKEVRNAGFASETQWFDRTVQRLQLTAKAFAKSLQEAGDPAACEAALRAMSHDERTHIRHSLETMTVAFRHSRDDGNDPAVKEAKRGLASAIGAQQQLDNEKLPPTVPRTAYSSPVTAKRSNSGTLVEY